MPNIQTSYAVAMPVAVPGMIADMRNRTVLSRVLSSAAVVGFGIAVLRGTGDNTVVSVGTAGATMLQGITVRDPTVRPVSAYPDTFQQYDIIPVMLRGIVWVINGGNAGVTPGAPAYYDPSGNISGVSAGNTAITNAVFESTAAAGALVKLRLG